MEKKNLHSVFKEGFKVGLGFEKFSDCPYKPGSPEYFQWLKGYESGNKEYMKKLEESEMFAKIG